VNGERAKRERKDGEKNQRTRERIMEMWAVLDPKIRARGMKKEREYALFSSPKKPKNFQNSTSHRILRHMHRALNIDENKI